MKNGIETQYEVSLAEVTDEAKISLDVYLVSRPDIDVSTNRLFMDKTVPGMISFECAACIPHRLHDKRLCTCLRYHPDDGWSQPWLP